jgi:hypothetical protein
MLKLNIRKSLFSKWKYLSKFNNWFTKFDFFSKWYIFVTFAHVYCQNIVWNIVYGLIESFITVLKSQYKIYSLCFPIKVQSKYLSLMKGKKTFCLQLSGRTWSFYNGILIGLYCSYCLKFVSYFSIFHFNFSCSTFFLQQILNVAIFHEN